MNYQVRRAERADLDRILAIYDSARRFMAESGNPNQWGKTNPPESQLRQDIEDGDLYAVTEGKTIHGVFAFFLSEDPTYAVIEGGSWHSDSPYGVLHRVASDGSGGILRAAVNYAGQFTDHLRIDTHRDNLPMQKAIGNMGFSYCGIIYLANGSPRLAYDRIDTDFQRKNRE